MPSGISVMLTVHKRPQNFERQLRSILKQTVKPDEIFVFWNYEKGYDLPVLRDAADDGIVTLIETSRNLGVWPRFTACLELQGPNIAVFDDDTIPGRRWLENCVGCMGYKQSLFGAVGIRFDTEARRPYTRFGWVNPNDNWERVDLVGQAWFFDKSLLRTFASLPRAGGPTCGEDYHISVAAQYHGLYVYVPPHVADCNDAWGSIHGELGRDDVALYKQPGEEEKKEAAHQAYLSRGWKLRCMG